MGIFDAIFDELGKNIKDAPGWLPLVIVCQALFWFIPSLTKPFEHLGLEVEKGTLATLTAVTLYFAGDVLDAVFFPRERDKKKTQKIFNTSMLLVGAFAVFLMLANGFLVGLLIGAVWCVFFPFLFWFLLARKESKTEPGRTAQKAEGGHTARDELLPPKVDKCREDETGCKWSVLYYTKLHDSRKDACVALGIDRWIYRVSMGLRSKTGESTIGRRFVIRFMNEAAKFLRSAVLALLVLGAYLGVTQRALVSAVVFGVIMPVILFFGSFFLKALHMRMLYNLAAETVRKDVDRYKCEYLNATLHRVTLAYDRSKGTAADERLRAIDEVLERDAKRILAESEARGKNWIRIFLWDHDLVDCFQTKADPLT